WVSQRTISFATPKTASSDPSGLNLGPLLQSPPADGSVALRTPVAASQTRIGACSPTVTSSLPSGLYARGMQPPLRVGGSWDDSRSLGCPVEPRTATSSAGAAAGLPAPTRASSAAGICSRLRPSSGLVSAASSSGVRGFHCPAGFPLP